VKLLMGDDSKVKAPKGRREAIWRQFCKTFLSVTDEFSLLSWSVC
jgi:hypothetical protein